ncbi:MAG: arylesterase [Betaproteobacteria bacterium HGW-Betaproteobacteria-8]|nr:MAG: arylesterase [Betaproteobacteria bacterium HGW-Betaproteobacteria-8]
MFRDFRFKFIQCFLLLLLATAGQTLAASASKPTILVFGDSLSAAYGIPRDQGWVALLQKQLDQPSLKREVINASISGETTSGGLTRLKQLLHQHQPDLILIQLGANDGLRGLPVADMRRNLGAMIELSQQSGAKVAIIGMMIPPNYGPRYTQEFMETYRLLAQKYKLPLVPFLLEGITEKPELMQDDGLHPTAAAQTIVLDNVWKVLAPYFKSITAKK